MGWREVLATGVRVAQQIHAADVASRPSPEQAYQQEMLAHARHQSLMAARADERAVRERQERQGRSGRWNALDYGDRY